jgi:LmbE family N-acetylglucosaminyl deacetylase
MRVTVISPHPDDETLGCGGTLLKHKAAGDQLSWIIVTSAYSPNWDETLLSKKDREIAEVAIAYGFEKVVRLGLPTMQLDSLKLGDVIGSIGDAVKQTKPAQLYLNHSGDVHSDHRIVFDATMSALKSFNSKLGVNRLLSYETLSSTEAAPAHSSRVFLPNVFSNVTPFIDRKLEIMSLYETELQPFPLPRAPESIRALARFRGATMGLEYAEAFMLIRELN